MAAVWTRLEGTSASAEQRKAALAAVKLRDGGLSVALEGGSKKVSDNM